MIVDAVTFDFWNTLVYEERGHMRDRRMAAWVGILKGAGFPVERDELHAIYDRAWDTYVRSWHANEQFGAAQAAAQIVKGLGYQLTPGLEEMLIEAFTSSSQDAQVHATGGIASCLERLKAAGLGLGIICDVGFTPSVILREFLKELDLFGYFDWFSFSDEVGYYKPAPEIFRHALAGLGGPAAARVAHVGDIRRTDIAGAKSMGMIAIRYTGISDDAGDEPPDELPPADHVVESHDQVPVVLGVV
ncbi:MAG: HAD family hydrolase [Acidimicrobiales bacterium]